MCYSSVWGAANVFSLTENNWVIPNVSNKSSCSAVSFYFAFNQQLNNYFQLNVFELQKINLECFFVKEIQENDLIWVKYFIMLFKSLQLNLSLCQTYLKPIKKKLFEANF